VTSLRPQLTARLRKRLEQLLRTVTHARELKRLQCVYLAATSDWPLDKIAQLLGVVPQEARNMLYDFRRQGVDGLVVEDQGRPRRQARLSLFQEEQLLRVLIEDARGGIPASATHAHDRMRSLYGDHLPKTLVYNVFRRHGWIPETAERSYDEGGPLETPYRPGNGSANPLMRQGAPGAAPLERCRGNASYHLVSADEECQVMRRLEKRVGKGEPVTRRDAQQLLSEAAGKEISKQTTARTLRRYGWQLVRHGSYSIWMPAGMEEEQVLLSRHVQARPEALLTCEEARRVLRSLKRLNRQGERVTTGKVRELIAAEVGEMPSRITVRKFLLRNGWLMQGEGVHSHWATAVEG